MKTHLLFSANQERQGKPREVRVDDKSRISQHFLVLSNARPADAGNEGIRFAETRQKLQVSQGPGVLALHPTFGLGEDCSQCVVLLSANRVRICWVITSTRASAFPF